MKGELGCAMKGSSASLGDREVGGLYVHVVAMSQDGLCKDRCVCNDSPSWPLYTSQVDLCAKLCKARFCKVLHSATTIHSIVL